VFGERYWSAVHTPVLDGAGEVLFVAQNAIDITDLYLFDLQREPGGPLAELYVDLVYQPVSGEDGMVTGIFSQGNDVTQAYETSRELAENVLDLEQVKARQAFQLRWADGVRGLAEDLRFGCRESYRACPINIYLQSHWHCRHVRRA
jgi:hypothetical protein